MTTFDVMNRSLAEGQQNIINLTEPNYDAYIEFLEFQQEIKFKKTITIEYCDLNDGYYYWGYPDKIWGDGTKWGASENTWTDWVIKEEIISTNYNNNGLATIITNLKDVWMYLAIGEGIPIDDAISLTDEVVRIERDELELFSDSFRSQYILDENTANGHLLQECGIACGATGNISSIGIFVPYDKNNFLSIMFSILTKIKLI